jgi:hypothetical protein
VELVLEPDPKLEAEAEPEPDAAPESSEPEADPVDDPKLKVEVDPDAASEPSEPEADPADEALKKAATVCWRLGGFSPVTSVEMSMSMVSWGLGWVVALSSERRVERWLRLRCSSGEDESSRSIRAFKFCRVEEEDAEEEEEGEGRWWPE